MATTSPGVTAAVPVTPAIRLTIPALVTTNASGNDHSCFRVTKKETTILGLACPLTLHPNLAESGSKETSLIPKQTAEAARGGMLGGGRQQKGMECSSQVVTLPHSNPALPGQQLRSTGWYPISIPEPTVAEDTDVPTVWVEMEIVAEGRGLGSWRFTEFYKGFGLNCHSHRCWPYRQRPGCVDKWLQHTPIV